MKKGKFLILGMLLMVLALGLVGCSSDEPYDGPKTIKITGFDNSVNVLENELTVESELGAWPPIARADNIVNGQTITCTLVNWADHWNNPEPWTGTGKFFIVIACYNPKDPSKTGAKYVYSADGKNPALIEIKDEVTMLQWSKFIWLKDYMGG